MAERVAARYAAAAAPITLPWLKKLLAYMVKANVDEQSEWSGSWTLAIHDVERMVRLFQNDDTYDVPKTVSEFYTRLEERGYLPAELLGLVKRIPVPRPPRVIPEGVLQAKVDAAVDTLRGLLPGSLQIHGEVEPVHLDEILRLVRAVQTVKARYPVPWKVMEKVVRMVRLNTRGHGTARAYWTMPSSPLVVNLRGKGAVEISAGMLVHELGHAFQDLQPDTQQIDGWERAYGNPPFSHGYLQGRSVEDFAECFRQFFLERTQLKSKAPVKYQDMLDRVQRL